MYLGLDLGTSGLRALLVDAEQKVLASTEASYSVSRPKNAWSEQNPADWIKACEKACGQLRKEHRKSFQAISAIGLAGHMHGATLLDKSMRVLRPCILWNDTRAALEAKQLDKQAIFRKITGNIVFPGFTAAKLQWVKKHEGEIFSKTAKILLPKDYLRLWLSGECLSDYSDSSGTSWLDVQKRSWSDELLAHCSLTRKQMPKLHEGTEAAGELRQELLEKWGFLGIGLSKKRSIIIAAGAGDNAAAACGIGAVNEGEGFLSLGSSGVLLSGKSMYRPAPEKALHSFCHALPSLWYQMGVMLSASDCLNWLASILGGSPASLTAALPKSISGPSRNLFQPYLSGERTPHNNASVRASFTGLDMSSSKESLCQSVLEGVAFGFRDNLHVLRQSGTNIKKLVAIGGGSQSQFWLESIATILGIPLEVPEQGEYGASLGAARLAMASHIKHVQPLDIMKGPKIKRIIEPKMHLQPLYLEKYQAFRELYTKLKKF